MRRHPSPDALGSIAAVAILAVAPILAVGGCAPTDAAPADDDRFDIVCTVGMVADIVRHVVGDRASVTNIIGEGVDPHLFQATTYDVGRLLEADVVFYSGLMLEGRMADTLVKIGRRGKPVYAVTERIDESYLLSPAEFAGHHDPHVWMDVAGWMQAVTAVGEAMADFDPPHADEYRRRAADYVEELRALDAYARSTIASIPRDRRVLVTAHDAFNYFGRAYGIDVLGIQGISTESEAGVEDINRLVDLIVRRGVPAVFVETSVADKSVRALIEGANARGATVVIGGSLFSDAMGAPGTYEGTYMGMIDHNATTIALGLGGSAPPRGMRGALGVAEGTSK